MKKSKKKAKEFNKEYDNYFMKMLARQMEKLINDGKFRLEDEKYIINEQFYSK